MSLKSRHRRTTRAAALPIRKMRAARRRWQLKSGKTCVSRHVKPRSTGWMTQLNLESPLTKLTSTYRGNRHLRISSPSPVQALSLTITADLVEELTHRLALETTLTSTQRGMYSRSISVNFYSRARIIKERITIKRWELRNNLSAKLVPLLKSCHLLRCQTTLKVRNCLSNQIKAIWLMRNRAIVLLLNY